MATFMAAAVMRMVPDSHFVLPGDIDNQVPLKFEVCVCYLALGSWHPLLSEMSKGG